MHFSIYPVSYLSTEYIYINGETTQASRHGGLDIDKTIKKPSETTVSLSTDSGPILHPGLRIGNCIMLKLSFIFHMLKVLD